MQSVRIFYAHTSDNRLCSFAQVVLEERRRIFEKLLEAYECALRSVAEAQLTVNSQMAEISRFRGDYFTRLLSLPDCLFLHTNLSAFQPLCPWSKICKVVSPSWLLKSASRVLPLPLLRER